MILEIFCCSGGMAEGLRRAGLHIDLAIDYDEDACASYEANLGHRPIKLDARDMLTMVRAGWRPADTIDLLVADPPCTPWSRAGKRLGVADERDIVRTTRATRICARRQLRRSSSRSFSMRPNARSMGRVPPEPDRRLIMETKRFQARQGDVFIEAAADGEVLSDATPVPREQGRVILAHGEVTGHSHAITGRGAKLFARGSARMLEVTARGGAILRHEEHAAIALPPGRYSVTIQREWTGEDERQVQD